MQKQSEVSKEINIVNTKVFSVDELNKALFDFEDLMERCLSPFLVLGDTAKDIKDGFLLGASKQDKVEVGLETKQLTEMVISTIETYKGVKVNKDMGKWTYMVDEVPVAVTLISKKYKFFQFPDQRFYWGGDYLLPNPFDSYYKSRFIIK